MPCNVKMFLYPYIHLLALVALSYAATVSQIFTIVDGMALNKTWSTIPSFSQHHCLYMCVKRDSCTSVNYNKNTEECQLSDIPSYMWHLFVQPNSSNIIIKKGILLYVYTNNDVLDLVFFVHNYIFIAITHICLLKSNKFI